MNNLCVKYINYYLTSSKSAKEKHWKLIEHA